MLRDSWDAPLEENLNHQMGLGSSSIIQTRIFLLFVWLFLHSFMILARLYCGIFLWFSHSFILSFFRRFSQEIWDANLKFVMCYSFLEGGRREGGGRDGFDARFSAILWDSLSQTVWNSLGLTGSRWSFVVGSSKSVQHSYKVVKRPKRVPCIIAVLSHYFWAIYSAWRFFDHVGNQKDPWTLTSDSLPLWLVDCLPGCLPSFLPSFLLSPLHFKERVTW